VTFDEKRDTVNRAIEDGNFCSVMDLYETQIRYLLPLKSSDEFYLSLQEDDMSLDGYLLERFSSIDRVIVSRDNVLRFAEEDGVLDNLKIPDVDITTPANFFAWLVAEGTPIYLECAEPGSRKTDFMLGRVEDCNPYSLSIRGFSLDCLWDKRAMTVNYDSVLRVCFGTKALLNFGKMLPKN